MLLFFAACSSPDDKPGGSPSDDSGDGAAPTWSAALCDRVRPGASGPATNAALSVLHTAARLFEPSNSFQTADDALAAMLQDEGALDDPDLAPYAAAFGGCGLDADDTALGAASVTLVGDVAWVVPGTGAVTLPTGTNAVAIDLRDVPDDPALRDALEEAVGPALATPTGWAGYETRSWDGYVDQVFSETNVYTVDKVDVAGAAIAATGSADLPMLVVTGEHLAPAAAELAIALRAADRAWIVGADVPAAVAESRWYARGAEGISFRAERLLDEAGDPLPDVFPADVSTNDAEGVVAAWADLAAPAPVTGAADRDGIKRRSPYGEEVATAHDLGTTRAALLVTHGTLRYFWPYFDVEGDTIDAVLDTTLDGLDPADRCDVEQRLGAFSAALSDGHVFFGDADAETGCLATNAGSLGVTVRFLDGAAVVVQTTYDDVLPGDTIEAIDGVDVDTLMDASLAWHGAATEGYRLDLAFRYLMRMAGDETLTLRDPDGVERDVTVAPVDYDTLATLPYTEADRPSGTLDDLGAPSVTYLNLDSFTTTDLSQVTDTLALAGDGGLVVDMRGYPGVDHYAVLDALIPGAYDSPQFVTPVYTGPEDLEWVEDQYHRTGDTDAYAGPIVLLVHPTTVSAAENFSMMLTSAGRTVAVIGEPSAGTNGNITGAMLPGQLYFTFTGMRLLFPDGSRFHGVGIVPDIEVVPTPADIRDGVDPVIEAAITTLGG